MHDDDDDDDHSYHVFTLFFKFRNMHKFFGMLFVISS